MYIHIYAYICMYSLTQTMICNSSNFSHILAAWEVNFLPLSQGGVKVSIKLNATAFH